MSDERIHTLDVAHDLIELGRAVEAIDLLDKEIPDRLSIPCAACGAADDQKCREEKTVPCDRCESNGTIVAHRLSTKRGVPPERVVVPCDMCGGRKEREVMADREIPHASRVLGIVRRW